MALLVCDDVPLAEVARAVGTPVHVYSAALMAERYRALDRAFAGVSPSAATTPSRPTPRSASSG